MKVASISEVIKVLQEYEEKHGVGAIVGIGTAGDGNRYIFDISNHPLSDDETAVDEVEVVRVDDTELFGKEV